MKKLTLVPSAEATFMSVAIVGVMPLFSILCTEAVETPARRASSASDQPRSARAAASFAPSAETVRSMSGSESGAIVRSALPFQDVIGVRWHDVSDSTRPAARRNLS